MHNRRGFGAAVTLVICLMTCPAALAETTLPPDPSPPATTTAPATTAPSAPAANFPLIRGDQGYLVAMAQRRLTWLGASINEAELASGRFGPSTRRAVSAFQSKYFGRQHGRIGKITFAALARIAGRIGDLPEECTEQSTLCVDMRQRVLRYVQDRQVVLTLDARFGMSGTPTARGTFHVRSKSRNHVSSKYHTWMPFAMFFHGGQAVHYSPYFDRDGYAGGSHGCVNLRDIKQAEWLFDHVSIGTRVHVYS